MEHTYHKDIQFISVHKCPDRNFYIPKAEDDPQSVYKGGSRFLSLNGTWQFRYYQKEEVYHETDSFIEVQVPMNYQYYGAGNVVYVNDHYLIDVKPPFVDDSAYAVYRKKIDLLIDSNSSYYINFEGKDSCLYLYVNGSFVGFDSVSHCTSEFDITDYLIQGSNEIVVFVYESCVGTYFECQDKFRLFGLTRDIYLLKREKKHIHAYQITYQKYEKDVQVCIHFDDPYHLEKELSVLDKKKLIAQVKTTENELHFMIKDAKLWNGEQPHLYQLQFTINHERIYDYLGLRFICFRKNILYLNGKKIKLLGVNHHDSSYEHGSYLSLHDYRQDLQLMMENHINAVRTAHYPPAPEFLYLCDEKGIYVMDEADIECHGIVRLSGQYQIDDFDRITDNLIFKQCLFDRISRMMIRDGNRCSVISFSAGNEAGFGQVMIEALKQMKEKDPTRLIHYESLYTSHERNQYQLDFISQMYSSIDKMKQTLKTDPRPLLLCEFSHAMGNSCGDIHDYVEFFYKHDRCMGGFIWEFNDHAFPIGLDLKKPGYGGDFKEKIHSSNFCVDGLFSYQRKPHSSLKEVKQAFAKIKVYRYHNAFYVSNRFDFLTLDEKYRIKLTIDNFNGFQKIYEFSLSSLPAKEKRFLLTIKHPDCVYNFEIYKNHQLYSFQSFVMKHFHYLPKKIKKAECVIKECDKTIKMQCNSLIVKIDKKNGMIHSLKNASDDFLRGGRLCLMRAPIDNDQYEIEKWKESGLFDRQLQLQQYHIKNHQLVCKVYVTNVLTGTITYSFDRQNQFVIDSCFVIDPKIAYLPRLGYSFLLPKRLKTYTYLGYGPYESYLDKYRLDQFGFYKQKISTRTDYIKPQEYNSHLSTFLMVQSQKETVQFYGMNSFSYLPYTIDELTKKKHGYELKANQNNILCLDYKMSGVGSHACGPELSEKYKLMEKKITFTIRIGETEHANR